MKNIVSYLVLLVGSLMAWKSVVSMDCVVPQVGWGKMSKKHSSYVCFGIKNDGFIGISANFTVRDSIDQKTSNSAAELPSAVSDNGSSLTKKLQKDSVPLPRPLTASRFTASPNHGSKLRISFKGGRGAFSEDAVLKAYPRCETLHCDEFEDAFKAVEIWLADRVVLPVESSVSGSIQQNYDLLLRHRLHIVGEVKLPINFNLLAVPGVRLEQLKRVLSHPKALAQSDMFLSKLGLVRENMEDTAGSAQLVASKQMMDAGVIASARAAEIYSLNILAERIQDDTNNLIRFLALARDPIIPRTDKAFKTSIVFTLEEGPGALYKALALFASREIKLAKIESRPQGKQPLRVVDDSNKGTAKHFDYLFHVDFEASMAEQRAQNALSHLQEVTTFLRVLGSYPVDAAI